MISACPNIYVLVIYLDNLNQVYNDSFVSRLKSKLYVCLLRIRIRLTKLFRVRKRILLSFLIQFSVFAYLGTVVFHFRFIESIYLFDYFKQHLLLFCSIILVFLILSGLTSLGYICAILTNNLFSSIYGICIGLLFLKHEPKNEFTTYFLCILTLSAVCFLQIIISAEIFINSRNLINNKAVKRSFKSIFTYLFFFLCASACLLLVLNKFLIIM